MSCIKLWHHTEIHKLRLSEGASGEHLVGVQFIAIDSAKKGKKSKKSASENVAEGNGAHSAQLTYPDIQNHLYIFDLMDAVSLIGMCNKDRMVRSLSLILAQESSKLKRLIGGHDNRKSLAELIYCNELAVRERIVERITLVEMFKHKAARGEGKSSQESFTRTYDRRDSD